MSKNLIVCCDGTWNDPDEQHDHEARPTNVAKFALTLASDFEGDGAAQPRQLVHYEKGVGTSARERLIGGGFGYGLSRNIRNGYRFLAEYYDPGDRVYLFGFSRGAYTARSLAGLIHNCGILRKECVGQVDAAFAFYRDRTNRTRPKTIGAQLFRERYSHAGSEVYFTGVWDTVGALGIPEQIPGWKELSKVFTGWKQMWGFHDTRLGPGVSFAYQALAIDEQRPPYEPTMWLKDEHASDTQTLEQVWFAGVHSEIGGGTIDASLSDIAFLWMLDKASKAGARLKPGQPHDGFADLDVLAAAPNYAAPIVQSRRGLWQLLHPYHRLTQQSVKSVPGQLIAKSAEHRFEEKIEGYSPNDFEEYRATFPTTPVSEGAPPA
ncbi:MAG TPA: DUF2235 domain-containing protein [Solirubrobacteraceae bacterium]|nr:DUF2235 domain-containing protein [Solirubrobacteraceae bacterium]